MLFRYSGSGALAISPNHIVLSIKTDFSPPEAQITVTIVNICSKPSTVLTENIGKQKQSNQ